MSKCRKCNRTLKREPWKSNGIGKICSQKEAAYLSRKQNESDSDTIVPYDGGDIWAERIPAPTFGLNSQTSLLIHTASGIKTNVQRIEYRHSRTGFNFGYGGSGPADLALNILLMIVPDKHFVDLIYQDFKFKFLGQDGNRLFIPREKIIDFIKEKRREQVGKVFSEGPAGSSIYAHGRTLDGKDIYPKVTKQ